LFELRGPSICWLFRYLPLFLINCVLSFSIFMSKYIFIAIVIFLFFVVHKCCFLFPLRSQASPSISFYWLQLTDLKIKSYFKVIKSCHWPDSTFKQTVEFINAFSTADHLSFWTYFTIMPLNIIIFSFFTSSLRFILLRIA
jgi:hypothetical protein